MRKGMFFRLAVTNIKKNKGTYFPYMITCAFCIAMLYLMRFIAANPGMETVLGASEIRTVMALGIIVTAIFSFIFLLYSNSFLMKRRQKEIGLYNILGLEKSHIGWMLLIETVLTSVISLCSGLAFGILMSKLILLFLLKLIHIPAQFGFYVSVSGIVGCCVLFGGIFLVTLLLNMGRIHLSHPVELLRGGNVGEREPKSKWLMALAGFVCLGVGYYLAVTTENPLTAIGIFFVAVLFVMLGTYLLFTAGSIVILKMLRWKKSFYYKIQNFTSVSGMIYRMKQNAVGLASICILSTGVLLMISSTVCLYFGMTDVVYSRYPYEINLGFRNLSLEEAEETVDTMLGMMEEEKIPTDQVVSDISLDIACEVEGNAVRFVAPEKVTDVLSTGYLCLIPESQYRKMTGKDTELSDGQILLYRESGATKDTLTIGEEAYQVKELLSEAPLLSDPDPFDYLDDLLVLVMTKADFAKVDQQQRECYGENCSSVDAEIGVDIRGSKEDEVAYKSVLADYAVELRDSGKLNELAWILAESRQENKDSFYSLYGGLLFLGIMLGTLFLMGTGMIIYYKQMSEGYEDRTRFQIMRKVGMSSREVKSSIHRQILMVFFLPLLMAILHIAMAFPLIRRLLAILYMQNVHLFFLCTAATILVFAVVYGIIYAITAKSYYRILERKNS